MSATAFLLKPGVSVGDGRYQLERRLGSGGMASVWLAADAVLQRNVAVKVLSDAFSDDPEYLARFRREARVAASLWHPNLVDVFDFDAEARPFLVMEYVDGGSLAEHLEAGRRLDGRRLAGELLSALAYIHAAGVLHRDVKPANVLLGTDGRSRLTDFGIARPRDATSLTQTGQVVGTARYIAPEVMNGEPASERSDLYACGVVIGQLDDPAEELAGLVAWLTRDDPGARPASASQALAELRGEPTPLAPSPPVESSGDERAPHAAAAPPPAVADPAHPPAVSDPTPPPAVSDPAQPPAVAQPAPQPVPGRSRGEGARRLMPVLALLALVAAVATIVVLGSGEDDPPSGSGPVAQQDRPRNGDRAAAAGGSVPEPVGADPEQAADLNDEGFNLIQSGQPEAAIPVLRRSVRAFPAGTEDPTYGYALFNLGNALRLAGRPEQAIPVLEERLEIPDQTSTVQAELDLAEAEAGE